MSKEVVIKHPCMTLWWETNGIVITTRYEKGEEPKGGLCVSHIVVSLTFHLTV
jgi:hypothetical protein